MFLVHSVQPYVRVIVGLSDYGIALLEVICGTVGNRGMEGDKYSSVALFAVC